MSKCLFCGNDLNDPNQQWSEIKALIGFVKVWPSLPEGQFNPDCDPCWALQQRIQCYSNGEILVRDKDWNWTRIRDADIVSSHDKEDETEQSACSAI